MKEIFVNLCNMKAIEPLSHGDRPTSRSKRLGTAWRPLVGLAVLAIAAWECGGGGGSSCSGGSDIQGEWRGPVTSDEAARGNPGTVFASITENNCTLGGNWTFTFEDPSLDKLFEIDGGSASQSAVDIVMFQCTGFANSCATLSTCSYGVTATRVSPTEMTGSYVASGTCASFDQGTFDISLVNRFTPTPAFTSTVAPTSTPTPPP
jgi:hypothetical protein